MFRESQEVSGPLFLGLPGRFIGIGLIRGMMTFQINSIPLSTNAIVNDWSLVNDLSTFFISTPKKKHAGLVQLDACFTDLYDPPNVVS